jgi:hypothetical protein
MEKGSSPEDVKELTACYVRCKDRVNRMYVYNCRTEKPRRNKKCKEHIYNF